MYHTPAAPVPAMIRAVAAAVLILPGSPGPPVAAAGPPADDRPAGAEQIQRDLKELGDRLRALRAAGPLAREKEDLLADAEVFRKGVLWALRVGAKLGAAGAARV